MKIQTDIENKRQIEKVILMQHTQLDQILNACDKQQGLICNMQQLVKPR
jgi:hypothetical protein